MKKNVKRPEVHEPVLNHEQGQILEWIKKVRFRHKLFGGVDEADLWKKIAELNDLYQKAISAERARYDALLAAAGESRKAGDDAGD